MKLNQQKMEEAVIAVLWLTLHDEVEAWKTIDWATMDRLHQRGFISDPRHRAKSVVFTEEGLARPNASRERSSLSSPPTANGHADDAAERAALLKRVMATVGTIRSGDPMLASKIGDTIRARILRKHNQESHASRRTH